MILVFGGTTEGRKAVEVLEEAGTTYYYSTKTGEQDIVQHHGIRLDGALDGEAMLQFCREHDIRLIVDAAHPFASQLHQTIGDVAERQDIPVVRYERIYPPRDPDFTWLDDYSQVPHDIRSLLATTGVQSIAKLKPLEAEGIKVFYRILPRESSIELAKRQGATDGQLCYYQDGETIDVDAEAILLKESGLSGGFLKKVEAARRRGMQVFVLKRPEITQGGRLFTCNGPHGLRRMVERLLPTFFPLHSGLTTGTCATAAAIAATLRLVKNETPAEVPVMLPNGETIAVPVSYGDGYAAVVKDAGDDPDVTNGLEIRAACQIRSGHEDAGIAIVGGEGVGHFTLPGFDYPPGEPAINKGPRQMMEHNLSLITSHSLQVTISVPQGAEIARRTFNPRLGIQGGISIIGVSGIVQPFSEEAFVSSIHKCLQVAKASGASPIVVHSGAKSARYLKVRYPDLPFQAFVEYGNFIGKTLQMAHELGIPQITLGIMLGKAVKLAEGQLDTHSKKGTMNLAFIQQLLDEANAGCSILHAQLTLARELWEMIPADKLPAFAKTVIAHCHTHCQPLLPNGELTILLIDDNGKIYS